MSTVLHHWIDGQATEGTPERHDPLHDPAVGAQTGRLPIASLEDVDAAVASAKAAFPGWRDTSLSQRNRIPFRFRDLVDRHSDELAALMSPPSPVLAAVEREHSRSGYSSDRVVVRGIGRPVGPHALEAQATVPLEDGRFARSESEVDCHPILFRPLACGEGKRQKRTIDALGPPSARPDFEGGVDRSREIEPDRTVMLRFELKHLGGFKYKTDVLDHTFGSDQQPGSVQ